MSQTWITRVRTCRAVVGRGDLVRPLIMGVELVTEMFGGGGVVRGIYRFGVLHL